jgi:hypothetical protein
VTSPPGTVFVGFVYKFVQARYRGVEGKVFEVIGHDLDCSVDVLFELHVLDPKMELADVDDVAVLFAQPPNALQPIEGARADRLHPLLGPIEVRLGGAGEQHEQS